MTFIMRKKKFKFNVSFEVEELSSIPFVNAVLFTKVRLLEGGTFCEMSSREEVWDHQVRWKCKCKFACKMIANVNTGVLEPCICRVSVRKEIKGGKSYQKLGFADINLAEFAGAGMTSRRYLLEGYDSKRRQDNSTLKVNIDMSLLSGDPLFKVPKSTTLTIHTEPVADELQPENKGPVPHEDYSEDSLASRGSSGFGSLPRKTRSSLVSGEGGSEQDLKKAVLPEQIEEEKSAASEPEAAADPGHSRNSSYASKQSEVSGYASSHAGNHSRQSSSSSFTHQRTASAGSSGDRFGSLHKQKKLEAAALLERRVDSTRVDADEIINDLFKNTDIADPDDSAEVSGLQLFVTKGGTAALSSQQIRNQAPGEKYEQVVFDTR